MAFLCCQFPALILFVLSLSVLCLSASVPHTKGRSCWKEGQVSPGSGGARECQRGGGVAHGLDSRPHSQKALGKALDIVNWLY